MWVWYNVSYVNVYGEGCLSVYIYICVSMCIYYIYISMCVYAAPVYTCVCVDMHAYVCILYVYIMYIK